MTRIVVPYSSSWPGDFDKEARAINAALDGALNDIHHIGSTSIPGMLAKPIIDILVDAVSLDASDAREDRMIRLGYEAKGAYGIDGRRYFRKTNADGTRTHHVHVFAHGSPAIEQHLAFRDYLQAHPDEAKAYADLKVSLVRRADISSNNYLDGKDAFIKEINHKALTWRRKAAL